MLHSTHQFFVKLPQYIADWVVYKYGEHGKRVGPVRLPWQSNHAGKVVFRSLVSNPSFEKITPMSYCSMMFCADIQDVPEEWRGRLPADRNEFLGFEVPREHWYMGRFFPCDDTMQLDKAGVAEFTYYIEDEFWDDVDAFHKDHKDQFEIDHPGRRHDEYNMLLDFVSFYHISIDSIDAFYRQYKRRKRRIEQEDAAIQAALDDKENNKTKSI